MMDSQNKMYRNTTDLQKEENKILKLAIAQMSIQVFVYDISSKKLFFFCNPSDLLQSMLNKTECLLEEFLTAGIVDDSYIAVFQELFDNIEQGEEHTEARVQFFKDKNEVWYHVVLSRCFQENSDSVLAVGTMQDISGRVEVEKRYINEKQYRCAMMADARRVYEINVTKDRFIRLESIQDSTDYGTWEPYTKTMNHMRETMVCQEDWETFMEIADREHLYKAFMQGKSEFYCEYRLIGEEGKYNWSSSATHLLRDPVSDDIKGFIYTKDIDEQKKQQLALAHEAQCDSLTGIYNRRTAEKLISQILESATDMDIGGFLIMDLDDFKLVNDTFGHSKGDQLLRRAAEEIRMVIRENDIAARIGGDEFIVFLHHVVDKERVERIASRICQAVSNIILDKNEKFRPTVSIGIAMYPMCGTTFTELYEHSDQALYQVKQHGKNHIDFFQR